MVAKLKDKPIKHEVIKQIDSMSKKYKVGTNTIVTVDALDALISRIEDCGIVGFDTETKGFSSHIVGISFAFTESEGAYIPVQHEHSQTQLQLFSDTGNKFSSKDQLPLALVLKKLKPVLENPGISFVGWNIGYDYRVMAGNDIHIKNIEDAQVMGWLVDENKSRALKDRSKEERIQKDTLKMSEFCDESNIQLSPIDYVSPYAIQDACLTFHLYKIFKEKLEQINMFEYYQSVEVPFIFVLSDMVMKGIRIDMKKIDEVKKYCQTTLESIEKEIFAEVGESFNISSGPQRAYILFEKLGLPIYKRTPGGAPSTDQNVLEELAKNGYAIAKKMIEYSTYNKLLTTYMDSYKNLADSFHRIHTSFNQTGTVSGRLSSSSPNLQNIPRDKRIRSLFVPNTGKKFVIADYGQLELRILTHFSQDKVMLNAFSNDVDLHTATACKIYDKQAQEVLPEERYLAKTVNFSIVYGSGAKPELGITKEFIQKWRQAHFGAFSYIKASHKEYAKTGYSRTIMGRYRRCPDILKSRDEGTVARYLREMFSAHIQGSAADVVKMAMIMVHSQLADEKLDADMIIQVHDEIIVECSEDCVDRVKEILQECMEKALPLKCPLEAKPNVGASWADKA
jgi:DNA polymerase I